MNWPKTIRLSYRTLRIKRVSPHSVSVQGQLGAGRNCSGEILLAKGMDDQEEANTLLHEIVHAALKLSGQDSEGEEKMVEALTSCLCQALQDNPKLWHKLMKSL